MNYADVVLQGLRETLQRPLGYIDATDEKYGEPPTDQNFDRYDPNKPADVLFNRPPLPEPTLSEWVRDRQAKEREPFQPWDEIIQRVSVGEFPTLKALAEAYGKRPAWAARLRDVAVRQGVFSAVAWKVCLSGKRRSNEQLTMRPSGRGGRAPRSRAQFEAVFREKQDALTLDLVVQLVRLGCWRTAQDFAAHFRRPERWAQAFRRLLMREQIMTADEWRACWKREPASKRSAGRPSASNGGRQEQQQNYNKNANSTNEGK